MTDPSLPGVPPGRITLLSDQSGPDAARIALPAPPPASPGQQDGRALRIAAALPGLVRLAGVFVAS